MLWQVKALIGWGKVQLHPHHSNDQPKSPSPIPPPWHFTTPNAAGRSGPHMKSAGVQLTCRGAARGPRVVLNISAESLSPCASRALLVKQIRNTENPCRNHGNTVLLKQCWLVRLRFIMSRGDRGGCVGERARAFGFAFLCPRSNQMQENCVNASL